MCLVHGTTVHGRSWLKFRLVLRLGLGSGLGFGLPGSLLRSCTLFVLASASPLYTVGSSRWYAWAEGTPADNNMFLSNSWCFLLSHQGAVQRARGIDGASRASASGGGGGGGGCIDGTPRRAKWVSGVIKRTDPDSGPRRAQTVQHSCPACGMCGGRVTRNTCTPDIQQVFFSVVCVEFLSRFLFF